MTVEAVEQTAVEMAEEEAAFEAAFSGTDSEPVEESAKEEPAEETKEETAPENVVTPEPEKELTVADLKAMIEEQRLSAKRDRDTFNGKYGELKQKLDAARTSTTGLSPKAKERLQSDFPELAQMLFDEGSIDTSGSATEMPKTATVDLDAITQTFERKLLTRDHKDWEEVVTSEEFVTWKQTSLTEEEAETFDNTWDSDLVSSRITEFKKFRDSQLTQQQQQEKQAQAEALAAQKKQERLDSAIVPRGQPRDFGSGYNDDDEEAEMEKAFRARRK